LEHAKIWVFFNHERSDVNLSVHKAVIKTLAEQDCGTENILVKGVCVQMPHVRSAATGRCNAESLSFPWFLLVVVTGEPGDFLEGLVQSRGVAWLGNICTPCRPVHSDSYCPPKERHWYIIKKKTYPVLD